MGGNTEKISSQLIPSISISIYTYNLPFMHIINNRALKQSEFKMNSILDFARFLSLGIWGLFWVVLPWWFVFGVFCWGFCAGGGDLPRGFVRGGLSRGVLSEGVLSGGFVQGCFVHGGFGPSGGFVQRSIVRGGFVRGICSGGGGGLS